MNDQELIEKNRKLMEGIWRTTPKETVLPAGFKGEHIRYIATDPWFLYVFGFVDEKKFTLEEWQAAFKDCKQPDGTYLISKEKFIQLGKFKHFGLVRKPLDISQLREGWYELKNWRKFCNEELIPSTTVGPKEFEKIEKSREQGGFLKNERILVDKLFKQRLQELLDACPSPARVRELNADAAYQEMVGKEVERSKAKVVKTTFESGQKISDKKKNALSDVLMKNEKLGSKPASEAASFSLKDLKKASKPKKTTI